MKHIVQCTESGEEHGCISLLPNSVPYDDFKHMSPEHREECKKKLKRDKEIVKGRYINRRGMNERFESTYCAGPGEPLQVWKLIPEHTYDLPRGLVDQINDSKIPIRSGLQCVDGAPVNKDGTPLEKDRFEVLHEIVPIKF